MAISYISQASATSDSVTLGTHASGDLLLVFAYNDGSATIPSLPSGWLNLHNVTAATGSYRIGFKVATTSSETSGTWTNADGIIAVVYRSDAGLVLPAFYSVNTSTSATLQHTSIPAVNNRENVDQWIIGLAVMRSDTNAIETPPTNMTNRSNLVGTGWEMALHDTNADSNNWVATNVTVATSALWRTFTAQIYEQPYPTTSGGGFRPVNIRGGADQ